MDGERVLISIVLSFVSSGDGGVRVDTLAVAPYRYGVLSVDDVLKRVAARTQLSGYG